LETSLSDFARHFMASGSPFPTQIGFYSIASGDRIKERATF